IPGQTLPVHHRRQHLVGVVEVVDGEAELLHVIGALGCEQSRYALAVVRIRDPGSGSYRAEATDGKALAIVQGLNAPDACYPLLEELPDSPPELLVSRDTWLQGFKLGDRKRPVGIGAGEGGIVLAVGDQSVTAPPADGRYPDVDSVLPKHGPLVK